MAVKKEQIRDLLGTGLSNEVVATAVGVSPSYISQLMSEDVFAEAVIALRTEALQANNSRDRRLDIIEDKLIATFEDKVDTGQIYKPIDVLRALQVINLAKRRGVAAHESVVINQRIVNLQIPAPVVRTFVQNKDGEVIEVEGQTLITMPAHTLLKELATKRDNGESYAKAARFLPSANQPTATDVATTQEAIKPGATNPTETLRHGGHSRFFGQKGV